jgi:hypothetical protein
MLYLGACVLCITERIGIDLMMEASRTTEILVNFYQTTRRYSPEDSHLKIKKLFTAEEAKVSYEICRA